MKFFLYFLVIGICVLIAFVRYLERTSVFFPSRPILKTPESIGLTYEDVYLETEDKIRLHGWFIPYAQAKSTLLFLHGNAGNISDRLDQIQIFHNMGVNVFIVDYRGYGLSSGHPTETGLYKDAIAAYDYLVKRLDIDPTKIVGYGSSLGGIVIVNLAMQRPLSVLIIDAAFTSVVDMAKVVYPFIPSFLIGIKLDAASKAKEITIPKLFIHSPDDETVPFYLGQKLFEAAAEPKEFLKIRGGHNDAHLVAKEEYASGITEFLRKYGLI